MKSTSKHLTEIHTWHVKLLSWLRLSSEFPVLSSLSVFQFPFHSPLKTPLSEFRVQPDKESSKCSSFEFNHIESSKFLNSKFNEREFKCIQRCRFNERGAFNGELTCHVCFFVKCGNGEFTKGLTCPLFWMMRGYCWTFKFWGTILSLAIFVRDENRELSLTFVKAPNLKGDSA